MVGESLVTDRARVSWVGRPVTVAPGSWVRMVCPGEKPSLSATTLGSSRPLSVVSGMASRGMATCFLVTVVGSSTSQTLEGNG